MELVLNRNSHNVFGTFGELIVGDKRFFTVEQDWEDNLPFLSCVPNGVYKLRYHQSPKHGDTFILDNTMLNIGRFKGEARRWGCLIHKANLASQLQGCIAPGTGMGWYRSQWSVTHSGDALQQIFELLGKEETHELIIGSDFPTFKEYV